MLKIPDSTVVVCLFQLFLSGAVDTVASGDDALSLLENSQMQKKVKAELVEVGSFFSKNTFLSFQ